MVLAYYPDQLVRDLVDLLILDRELQWAGVRLETITTESDGSPEGHMFFQFKGAFAERVRHGLEDLSFPERQEVLRLLVEGVTCYEGRATVRTIIPTKPPKQDVHSHNHTGRGAG